ncbi:hypothetical protein KCP73_14570 [Salmonella enterica subsp. enterica]|nr:hypothetical protein KCP73_14570 [Salmonella enterica subsp. enterica]
MMIGFVRSGVSPSAVITPPSRRKGKLIVVGRVRIRRCRQSSPKRIRAVVNDVTAAIVGQEGFTIRRASILIVAAGRR